MAASARIGYTNTPIKLAVNYIILAKQQLARAKAEADCITGGGVTPANLEGNADFQVAANQGAAFYTCFTGMAANLAAVTDSELAKLDQG